MGCAEVFDGCLVRGVQLRAGVNLQRNRIHRQGDRPFLVGGVVRVTAGEDEVFSAGGRHHEFLAGRTPNGTAIGLYGNGL